MRTTILCSNNVIVTLRFGVVNALSQLEDQIKERKYREIVHSLAVRRAALRAEDLVLMSPPGSQADRRVIQAIHICTPDIPTVAPDTRDTSRIAFHG